MKRLVTIILSMVFILGLVGCGNQSSTDNVVKVGQTWVISDDNPLDGGNAWSITSHGIGEYVYMQNPDGTLSSRYVESLKHVNPHEWTMELKKDAKFADGTNVDAKALASCLNEIMEKNKLSHATAGVIKYEPTGDYTIKATTERVTNDLASILAEWTNVVFKKDQNGKYVFSGPFKIKSLKPQAELTLVPNENYPEANQRPSEVIIKAFKDNNAMKLAFESGDIDLAYGITGEVADQLRKDHHVIDFDAGYQYYTFLNLNNSILKDKNVREAINLALDRDAFIKALHGGHLPTGLFAGYNSYDAKLKVTTDTKKAAELLEQEGWKLGKDGYRTKDGKELTFRITTYSSRPDLPIIAQVMVSELAKIGIKTQVNVVDNIGSVTKSRDFDIIVYAQHPSPAGSPLYFLNQFFRTGASNNFTGYSNVNTDNLLNELGTQTDKAGVDKYAIEVQKQVVSDYPVLLTLDPVWHAAVSKKLADYKIWNGDYYIINSTLKIKG